MTKEALKQEVVPIGQGLFVLPTSPAEKPYLIGNKCRSCGEISFPSRVCCRHCSSYDMEEINFRRIGKLYGFTTVRVKPPHCIIPVPYMTGIVELDGGERIRTLLTDCDQSSLEIGMEMELVIESIGKAVEAIGEIKIGDEILGWKFRHVRRKQQ